MSNMCSILFFFLVSLYSIHRYGGGALPKRLYMLHNFLTDK